MTNWVTIKIPEETRDDARDVDERTYGELMQLGIEAYQADIVGVNSDGDIWVNVNQGDPDERADIDEIAEQLKEDLSMAADPGVNEAEIVDNVVNRIDDLETELKTQIEALQR